MFEYGTTEPPNIMDLDLIQQPQFCCQVMSQRLVVT